MKKILVVFTGGTIESSTNNELIINKNLLDKYKIIML